MLMRVPKATIRTDVSVPLRFADGYATNARVFSFDGLVDGREHLAFALGELADATSAGDRFPLVRPHSECLTGDVFGSQRCDCGSQLEAALQAGVLFAPGRLYGAPDGYLRLTYASLSAARAADAIQRLSSMIDHLSQTNVT